MKSAPAISIITPVWNGLPLIKQCIASVLAQDFKNWELIVSDNASTDGTPEYLDTLNDPRIRIYKQQENLGIMGNVNFLFSQARAPLSQILCADDYFLNPRSLSGIIGYWANASPEIGMARFGYTEVQYKGIKNKEEGIPHTLSPDNALMWFFVFGNFMGNLSYLSIRTPLVSKYGYFHPTMNYVGDFEFWARLARKVSMEVGRKPVIYVREHDKSATSRQFFNGSLFEQHLLIYEKLIEDLALYFDRQRLIDYFNYDVCSMHYRFALKAITKGQYIYLKKILRSRSAILWPKWKQLLICLPLAIFNLRSRVTYNMGIGLINDQLARQNQANISSTNNSSTNNNLTNHISTKISTL